MSVEMEKKDGDYFDPWDYNESRPKKYGPGNAKQWSSEDIQAGRDELFKKGSEYLRTKREDVVGIDNVLVEIDEVIHWLRNSKDYQQHGARLEPGVIFEGDPGTGKTLVSRYIATEADALFVNVRDFPHKGSLFTDSDIRELFRRARQAYREEGRPVILFWDEFENGAVERSSATPEQVATVSQITAELDGVSGKNEGVLLIGCTNYIYGIDAALKRSGRMGLQIEFNPPDRNGKKLLLTHYLDKYTTEGDIDVDTLSYFFDSDATAADIEEACMEAWRYAVRRDVVAPTLAQQDLIDVFIKRLVGPPTAFINLPMEERARIAVHEVGHAIMALVYDIPLRLITVQPGKKSLGRVITAEIQDHIGTVDEMVSQMRVGIGSVVAEDIAMVPALLGSTGDIKSVNQLAAKLVDNLFSGDRTGIFNAKAVASTRTGKMSEGGATPSISESAVSRSDEDVDALLRSTLTDAMQVMADIGHDALWQIAHVVNEKVTLTGDQFREVFVNTTGREPKEFRPRA